MLRGGGVIFCSILYFLSIHGLALCFRDTLPNNVFPDMLAVLARLSINLSAKLKGGPVTNDKVIHLVEICTECFRSLRNACAGCKRNQEEVLRSFDSESSEIE